MICVRTVNFALRGARSWLYQTQTNTFFEFLKGLIRGLGTVLGGTIIVALLLWLLSQLNQLPFVGNLADAAQNSVDTAAKSE